MSEPSAESLVRAKGFMERIVALDWAKDGEAEHALATLLNTIREEERGRMRREEAARIAELLSLPD